MNKKFVIANTRDEKYVIVLGLFLIIVILYYFVMAPAWDKGEILKLDAEAAKTELIRVQTIVSDLEKLKKEEIAIKSELLKKYSKFFYSISEPRILNKLDILISSSAFPVSGLSFSKVEPGEITVDKIRYKPLRYPLMELAAISNTTLKIEPTAEEEADASTDELTSDSVAFSDVIVRYDNTTYEPIFLFMKSLEKLDRSIIIKNISITNSGSGGLKGELVLGFYSISKPNESENDDLAFTNILPKGKTNPFQ